MRYILFSIALSLVAINLSYGQGGIEIKDAWVRETPPGSNITALYLNIKNTGEKSDTLNSVSTNVSESSEIHKTSLDDKGVAKMEMMKSVTIGSGETVNFEPGGMHIMLIGLQQPIKSGDIVEVKLNFETTGETTIKAKVVGLSANKEHHQNHH